MYLLVADRDHTSEAPQPLSIQHVHQLTSRVPTPLQNVVELLDDCFQRAAIAPGEPDDLNFIKKHASVMRSQVSSSPVTRAGLTV